MYAHQVEEVELEFEVEENNVELLTAQCGTVEVLSQECRLLNSGLVKVIATLKLPVLSMVIRKVKISKLRKSLD